MPYLSARQNGSSRRMWPPPLIVIWMRSFMFVPDNHSALISCYEIRLERHKP